MSEPIQTMSESGSQTGKKSMTLQVQVERDVSNQDARQKFNAGSAEPSDEAKRTLLESAFLEMEAVAS